MEFPPLVKQLFVASSPQLAAFSMGGVIGFPNVILEQFRANDSSIHVDLDMSTWIGSTHGLAGIPSIFTPIIMQKIGRKFSFIISCILIIIGWTLVYFAGNITTILVAECIHGFGSSSIMIVSIFTISEMVNPKFRTVSMTLYGINQMFGMSVVGIIGRYVHWKNVGLIMCSPIVISLVISCSWPESPEWLAWKGKYDKCEIAFKWLRGTNEQAQKELFALLNAHREKVLSNKTSKRNRTLKEIWMQISRRDFYIPCFQSFVCLSSLFWSGTMVVLIYAMDMIRKATENESAAFYGMISIHIISAVGVLCTAFLLKLFKNKTVLLSSTLGDAICLFAACVVTYLQSIDVLSKQSLLGLYCLICIMITTSLGLSTIPIAMAAELMPVKHRGIGGAMYIIFASILHTSSLKISPYLFVYIGLWGTFLLYTANQIICSFYIWKYVPETKGCTLTELEDFYNYGKFIRRDNEAISNLDSKLDH